MDLDALQNLLQSLQQQPQTLPLQPAHVTPISSNLTTHPSVQSLSSASHPQPALNGFNHFNAIQTSIPLTSYAFSHPSTSSLSSQLIQSSIPTIPTIQPAQAIQPIQPTPVLNDLPTNSSSNNLSIPHSTDQIFALLSALKPLNPNPTFSTQSSAQLNPNSTLSSLSHPCALDSSLHHPQKRVKIDETYSKELPHLNPFQINLSNPDIHSPQIDDLLSLNSTNHQNSHSKTDQCIAEVKRHDENHNEQTKENHQTIAQERDQDKDLSQLSLSEALPILTKLIKDSGFLEIFQEIKEQQDQLELRLIDERNRIKIENEKKLKKSVLGIDPKLPRYTKEQKVFKFQHEFDDEMRKFDLTALERWDKLKLQQQNELQRLKVPTFFPTNDSKILNRQNQVVQIIFEAINETNSKT
ncbi:hypothetical protein O181_043412 [Austropuccinia psidii MF-1]|uniref:Uncharacterized protein n=1 Tax=Austropuccinia psidii MF-1 TaxID=1389203 RepID=A0A9Q3HGT4_9BASI|nr:hypothetical protein [Austropuccinia psidii MF-1]